MTSRSALTMLFYAHMFRQFSFFFFVSPAFRSDLKDACVKMYVSQLHCLQAGGWDMINFCFCCSVDGSCCCFEMSHCFKHAIWMDEFVCAGNGSHLCWPVSSGSLGLLWRVQPSGGAHAVSCVAADSNHPGNPQGTCQPGQERQRYEWQWCFFPAVKKGPL